MPKTLPGIRPAARSISFEQRLVNASDGAIIVSVLLWFGAFAWIRALRLPDEGRYAGVAWDMLRSDSPLTPLINGMAYFHKPPLYYWLCQLSFSIFGFSAWAARVPSLLAATLIVTLLLKFLTAQAGRKTAVITVLILATAPLFYGGAQFANMDMLVAALIGATILQGSSTILAPAATRWGGVATGICAAAAVLAKGLIGIALPGAVLLIWAFCIGRPRTLLRFLSPAPILAFCVAALPWFVIMQRQYEGFFQYFFIYQQVSRFAIGGFNNAQPTLFYLPLVLVAALPWTIWLVRMRLASIRAAFWNDPISKLMTIWLAVILVFFSIPNSKLVGYVLPVLPPFAFLLSQWVLGPAQANGRFSRPRAFRASIIGAVVICLVVVAVAARHDGGSGRETALELKRRMQPDDIVMTLQSFPFDLQLYAQLQRPVWVIDAWDDPKIPLRDNWRKELFDAAKFTPARGAENLLTPLQLKQRMCDPKFAGRHFWVWGRRRDAVGDYAFPDTVPQFTAGRYTVWRVTPKEMPKAYGCSP